MLGVFCSLLWGMGFGMNLVAAPLGMTVSTSASTCGNPNGTIIATGTGGTGPYTYSLNGAPYVASGTFNGLVGGAYTVTVMDFTGTTFAQGVALGNIAGPSIFVTPTAATCANNDGELDITVTSGTPPFQYSVDNSAWGSGNLIGGLASGNRWVRVQDNNGCLVQQNVNIPLNNNLTLTMGPGSTICQGTSAPLTLTTNATTFSWTPANFVDNPTAAQPEADPPSTLTYTVTASLGVCTSTGQETMTVLPAPKPTATPIAQLCYGQSAQLQGSGGVTYQWSPATYLSSTTIPNPVVQKPQQSISYNLNVTDANGCTSVSPAVILVVVTPPPVVFAGDDTAILVGQTLQLNAVDVNNAGFTSYSWSPALGLDNPSIQDPVATVTGDITYVVTAVTPQGCTGSDSVTIKAVNTSEIVVANAFTPGKGGRNDLLRPHGIGVQDLKYFRIFNRWGQQVFMTTNAGLGWDGRVGGQEQPMGVYVWEAEGLDFSGNPVVRRGTVILIR